MASSEGQKKLRTDLTRGFILGGTSAGANFTAGIAHLARQEGLSPQITGLVFLAGSFCHPDVRPEQYRDRILSIDEINDAPGLTRKSIDYFASKSPTSPLLFETAAYLGIVHQANMALHLKINDFLLFFLILMGASPKKYTSQYVDGILDVMRLSCLMNFSVKLA